MIYKFKIPDHGEFQLCIDEDDVHRFTDCEFLYKNSSNDITSLSIDFVYIFIEEMLGRLNNIISLDDFPSCFGQIGKWQEYYYYNRYYNRVHSIEIGKMNDSLFVSTPKYGTFVYRFKGDVWIEINRGYDENIKMTPYEYYKDPLNYRVLLATLPKDIVFEWENTLLEIWMPPVDWMFEKVKDERLFFR